MLSVGIGEIQKNTAIFSNLKESIQIVDKRKHQVLAIVYPVNQVKNSIAKKLAGKYKNQVQGGQKALQSLENLQDIKQKALLQALGEKYGLSH
ncbi:hypothetical protein [Helicobacter zhangjianzhongii]|uniref:Uncharacterized protein n=1 Tax=Helicobacter zhangjianzhongii TaxID=2974574 RepID=A0ACC6FS91_9HELI|nr:MULTISPECIES: hypothetical protein [unclassified Helicobacter]MDL0079985.1 hypothetical protein [Helicobacter sp. CPD2-1]MDL0081772.1 hypothetical protein [Helicobacter sp. XJK30-2]